jgi:uncharacterized repeat protein (TIGR01451 family)
MRTKYYLLSVLGALAVAVGVMALATSAQAQTPARECATFGNGQACLEKTVSPDPVTVGETINFTIRVTNENTALTFNDPFLLVDTLPPGLQVVSVTQSVTPPGTTPTCIVGGNTVTCPGPRIIPPGGAFTLTIEATPTECGDFVNTATNQTFTVEAPFTVVGCDEEAGAGGGVGGGADGGGAAPINQEGEQESEAGEIDQSFDVS